MNQRHFLTGLIFILACIVVLLVFRMEETTGALITPTEEGPARQLVEITIKGESMAPTFNHGDVVYGDIGPEALTNIEVGDIILFEEPEDIPSEEGYLIKRVVALTGDRVEIRHGVLLVNKVFVDSGTIAGSDFEAYVVEENGVFVLGDNCGISMDSRHFKNPTVPLSSIVAVIDEEDQ